MIKHINCYLIVSIVVVQCQLKLTPVSDNIRCGGVQYWTDIHIEEEVSRNFLLISRIKG